MEALRSGVYTPWEFTPRRDAETLAALSRLAVLPDDIAALVDDGRVISNFIIQALKGERLTIYGDGSQTRSFCYVDDLIEGLMRLMASPRKMPSMAGFGLEITGYFTPEGEKTA